MVTTLLLIIIYVSFISLGLPDSLLGSAWPVMYGGLSVPISYAGVISMVIAGGTVVSSVMSDRVVRRFGTGKTTAVSVLMTAAALLGFSLSGSFAALVLCAVPLGLGAGSVDVGLNNYVALHYKARHMNWLHCFWGIGAALGPVIMSAYLTAGSSWRSGYRTISVIQFCLTAALFIALPLWKRAGGAEEPGESDKKPPMRFSALLRLPGAIPALVSFFCYCALESTAGLWGGSFLVIAKGIAPETAAKWVSLFYIGITVGRFLAGFLTVRFSNRQMVRLGQVIVAAGLVLLLLPLKNTALLAGLFMAGLGCAPIFPSLLHETPVNFGEDNSQALMGVQMAGAYVGSTLMPPLFGMLAARLSYGLFPVYLAAFLVLMFLTVETLNRTIVKHDGKTQ